jgi:NAD(P)-dependent dehydrogenase (short-subunit alcohol dehydrogenase family)
MTNIEGAVAVVTGGASGIGRGIAEVLAERCARVVIADIEKAAIDRATAELGVVGARVDVADPASVAALADEVMRRYGRVDIVVNNAGVGPVGPISDLTLADWDWVLDVNLRGVIHGVHTFLPLLRANAEGGHLVNTASMAAFAPLANLGAYAASKAAVAALSEVLAAELADEGSRVHVTLLTPGSVNTGISRSLRNRPAAPAGGLQEADFAADPEKAATLVWRTPLEVGRVVARAIENDDFYAITHPNLLPRVEDRHAGIRAAFERYPAVGSE